MEFLDFKRIGYAYEREEWVLRSFDRFATQHPRQSMRQVIQLWLARIPNRQAIRRSHDFTVIRQWGLFRRRIDQQSFVPDDVPLAPSARTRFQPCLLSISQVRELLRCKSKRHGPLTRARIRTLLLVLYCTGLRVGEAIKLRLVDVDLKQGCFRVGPSKGRVRWVPFGRDLVRELKHWLDLRRRAGFVLTPQTTLFEREDGEPENRKSICAVLTVLFRQCGLKPRRGRKGLRVHDLRHVFCIHRLQRWYRAGVDPGPLLPWLSAYLGHVDLLGTEKYLRATPELLGDKFGHIMNYGDGVYAGQFVGGMYTEAYFEKDVIKVIEAGLKCIPRESQYAGMVRDMVDWYRQDPEDWQKTWGLVEEKYHKDERYHHRYAEKSIEVKLNGAYILMGLLYGKGDFAKTIEISTRCGQDSDCNPANAGGVLGAIFGFASVPERFKSALDEKCLFFASTYDWAEMLRVHEHLARQVIRKYGGRFEKDASGQEVFLIPVQTAQPGLLEKSWEPGPVTGLKYSEEEVAQMIGPIEPFAPGWKVKNCGGPLDNAKKYLERDNVMMTRPLNATTPWILYKKMELIAYNYPSPWESDLPAQPVPDELDWEMWCGPNPKVPFNQDLYLPRANPGWLSFRPYSGGEMTGWGAHGFDQIQCALGMDDTGPVEIWTEGGKFNPPTYTKPEPKGRGDKICLEPKVFFRYANGVLVEPGTEATMGGAVFYGEKGRVAIARGKCESDPAELAVEALRERPADFNDNRQKNWLNCIKSRAKPIADVEIGHRSATVCHLCNIARWTGRKLRWDPVNEKFVGDADANKYLDRERRKPWTLPERI